MINHPAFALTLFRIQPVLTELNASVGWDPRPPTSFRDMPGPTSRRCWHAGRFHRQYHHTRPGCNVYPQSGMHFRQPTPRLVIGGVPPSANPRGVSRVRAPPGLPEPWWLSEPGPGWPPQATTGGPRGPPATGRWAPETPLRTLILGGWARGAQNGQKMPIFPPLRCKVVGEWGGSAH